MSVFQSKSTTEKSHLQVSVNWVKNGLIWGGLMYFIMTFVFPYIDGHELSMQQVLINVPAWLVCGLAYGLAMKWYYDWSRSRQRRKEVS